MTQDEFFKRYRYSTSRDLLGGGGFGKVYKALDTFTNNSVAIKISEQNTIDGHTFSLKNEFEALNRVPPHRNIAGYSDIYTFEMPTGVFDFVVMQYYPDGNLSQLIKKEKLSEEQKENIALGLIDGIGNLHEYGVVHRDLKPSNILIEKETIKGKTEYIPKIIDFGLSKKADAGDKSHFTNSITAGTYIYSSPEQLQGKALKFNTDWWSWGAIIYELFTGKRMFEVDKTTTGSSALDISKILENILKKDHSDKIEDVPQKWQAVLKVCFERDPNKRVQNASDIIQILGEISWVAEDDKDKTVVVGGSESKDKVEAQVEKNDSGEKVKKQSNKREYILAGGVILITLLFSFFYENSTITPNYEHELYEENGLFGYKKGDSVVIAPKYLSAENFADGKAKVSTEDSIYYIDKSGRMVEFVCLTPDAAAWKLATKANTKPDYEYYLSQFPEGKYIGDAQNKIQHIDKEEQEKIAEAERKKQEERKKEQSQAIVAINSQMVYVSGGTFTMGCTGPRAWIRRPQSAQDGTSEEGNYCPQEEQPAHTVTLSGYYMGKYPVTQKQWRAIMGNNPSHFKNCDNCPVERVSWDDVQDFLRALNKKTGKNYRLPTEAEWEFAARGGNKSKGYKYSGSNNIDDVAWFIGNSGQKPHPVGQKLGNELGIYDMNGNVNEWCSDWYADDYYSNSPQNNPQGASSGSYRALRGGSWFFNAYSSRVSSRYRLERDTRFNTNGFRIVLSE